MNHKGRAKATINRYERARGEFEATIQQFQEYQAQRKGDIHDLDGVIQGSLQNIRLAAENSVYGAKVMEAIDNMPGVKLIEQRFGNIIDRQAFGSNGESNGPGADFGAGVGTAGIGAAAGVGVAGIGVGIGAAAGAYGLAGAIGVASTGAAIGGLSGAAATSASLAWLGGGALAAGGLGMAGGLAALTGIGLIPLAAAGIVGGVMYKKKNKKRADVLEQEVKEKISAMNQVQMAMARGKEQLSDFGSVVRQHTAQIRVLNNRHLGPAIREDRADLVVNSVRTLLSAIHEAIAETLDLWEKTTGQSNEATQPANVSIT